MNKSLSHYSTSFYDTDGRAAPDDEQFAGQMALKVAEELGDLPAFDRTLEEAEVEVQC